MFWALLVFLVAFPLALLVGAARPVSDAHLRRLAATTRCSLGSGSELLAGQLRRRRVAAALGAVCGLWATASWQSATWSWDGLVPIVAPSTSGMSSSVGQLTFDGGSFLLTVNVFGLVVGLAAGVVLAEWMSRPAPVEARRLAQLAPRQARAYIAGPGRFLLSGAGAAAVAALIAGIAADAQGTLGVVEPVSTATRAWAVTLIVLAVVAALTRAWVVAVPSHSDTVELVIVCEVTRCLTVATLTITAAAAALGSASASLGLLATAYGWGWGDAFAAFSIACSLLAGGLAFSCFVTPYWAMAVDLADTSAADISA